MTVDNFIFHCKIDVDKKLKLNRLFRKIKFVSYNIWSSIKNTLSVKKYQRQLIIFVANTHIIIIEEIL